MSKDLHLVSRSFALCDVFVYIAVLVTCQVDCLLTMRYTTASLQIVVGIEPSNFSLSNRIPGEIKPEIEPITEDTVRRMENPGQVEVCKSSSNVNEKK